VYLEAGFFPAKLARHSPGAHPVQPWFVRKSRESPANRTEQTGHRWFWKQKSSLPIFDRFSQTARLMPDWKRAKSLCVHLTESTWLIARRHQHEVASRKNSAAVSLVETDTDGDGLRMALCQSFGSRLQLRLSAAH
jgi:hypothetical protein